MADRMTIARPYAKAAFEEARASGHLGDWSAALATATDVVQDERVQNLLDNPEVTPAELATFVISIAGSEMGEHGRNFVRTLADNHRLGYLPEIQTLFDELKDAAEGIANVTVTSAVPLDEATKGKLSQALARRLKREIRLHCVTDPTLIGGAVLRTGDLVIDGSMRSRLQQMQYELTA